MTQETHYLEEELYSLIKTDQSIFEFIQESSLDGLWYWDLNSPEHEWMSPSFWKTLGYDPASMPHRVEAWQEIIFPEDLEAAKQEIFRHFSDPTIPYDQIVRYRHQDGSTVWVRCRGLAVRDEQGKPIRMLGAHSDITSLKRHEATLQQMMQEADAARAELQSFLDDANDLIQSIDQAGNYLYVNKAWCRTLGYTQQEALKRTIYDIVDPSCHTYCQQQLRGLIQTQQQVLVHVVFRSKSGARVTVEGNVNIHSKANEELVLRGIFRDVTQRQQAEEELHRTKEMLEQTNTVARVGGWEMDLLTNTLYWTHMTREIHEVDEDFVPALDTAINFYEAGESQESIKQAFTGVVENGEEFDRELKIVTAKGNERWVRSIGRAEFRGGQCVRIYGTFQDISEQKMHEQCIIQAMAEAEAASIAKSEFLANMSHEIRTPLNGVIGFSDLLMKTSLNENQTQYMQAVHHSANALLDLINDILDFSKIEAGKLELSQERCDLWQLLEQVSDIIRHKIEEKNIELLLNVSPQLPRYAWVDPIRIRQILINLLSNAVKFTEEGEIEILVQPTSPVATDEVYCVEFSIRDTGIGISPERQHAIFSAFSQEDASTTRKYGGTGLGLSISNQLLGLMSSEMQLESQPGEGSRFFFHLEVKMEQQGFEVQRDIRNIQRVLVVDDHEKNRKILHEMLLLKGIESHTVSNGWEALEKLKECQYDLLIVDYNMPDMDGIQVIRQVRETLNVAREALTIVLLHSGADDNTINAVRQPLGIHKVISKPISLYQLTNTLIDLDTPHLNNVPSTEPSEVVTTRAMDILLVDDNPMNRLLAKTMILKVLPNATIEEATDGFDAVAKVQTLQPELVFMDVQMPRMSGYEASQQIRTMSLAHPLTIIALTAGTVKGERERCLKAGMDDYLSKPFVMGTLRPKIEFWLNQEGDLEHDEPKVSDERSLHHFDLQNCLITLGDDPALIEELLRSLFEQLDEDRPRIQRAYEEKDLDTLKKIGHNHKGGASMVNMNVLASLFAQLERQKKFDQEIVSVLIGQIEEEIEYVRALAYTEHPQDE